MAFFSFFPFKPHMTQSTVTMILERLLADYQQGKRLVLAFDYDGTLVPFATHPNLAQLDPQVREILARLAALPRVTVAIISGRGLDDVMNMVDLPALSYGGSTGLELAVKGWRHIPGEAVASRPLVNSLRAAFDSRLAAYAGAWVEEKPFGFTIHYRLVAPAQVERLRAEALAFLSPYAASVAVLEGPLALEVMPAIARNKGTALRAIVAYANEAPTTVLFAGDSANDAPALAAATALGRPGDWP